MFYLKYQDSKYNHLPFRLNTNRTILNISQHHVLHFINFFYTNRLSSIWSFLKKLLKVSIEKFLNPGLRAIQINPLPRLITMLLRHTAQSLIFSNMLLSNLLLPMIIVTRRAANATKRSPTKPAEKLVNIYVFHTSSINFLCTLCDFHS